MPKPIPTPIPPESIGAVLSVRGASDKLVEYTLSDGQTGILGTEEHLFDLSGESPPDIALTQLNKCETKLGALNTSIVLKVNDDIRVIASNEIFNFPDEWGTAEAESV